MDNVKFLYFRPAGYGKGYTSSENIDLVFEICPRLSNYLREQSKCPPYMLCKILDNIPLECFVNDYHLIMLKSQMEDIRYEQMFSRASMEI